MFHSCLALDEGKNKINVFTVGIYSRKQAREIKVNVNERKINA